jgi:hypothetical protein
VHLAISSADAPSFPGSLHVKGSTGYDQTLDIASNFTANGDAIDVEFKKVPTNAQYSLSYINSYGEEDLMAENVPFKDLQDPRAPWGGQ